MFKRHFCRSQKYFLTHLRSFFNVILNADSEYVFSFVVSYLELEKNDLKVLFINILYSHIHTTMAEKSRFITLIIARNKQ